MTDGAVVGPIDPPAMQVMSYNIRRRLPHLNPMSPDRWARRRPLLTRLLTAEQPTVLGVQEAMPDQAESVASALGARYSYVGRGREANGSGEGCPLYFDTDRLELLEWKQTALSATPDVAGSMTWGNRVPRIVVAATFRDRATARDFLVVNTHLDHLFHASRVSSVRALRDLVLAAKKPSIVMGDFNTDAGSAPHSEIVAGGRLRDSWLVGERATESWGTFPDYREPRHGRKRIDWILVTRRVEVLTAAINITRYDGAWPSDHTPVQAVVRIR